MNLPIKKTKDIEILLKRRFIINNHEKCLHARDIKEKGVRINTSMSILTFNIIVRRIY